MTNNEQTIIQSNPKPALPCRHTTCSSSLTDTITYTQVSGIIAGQLFIGLFADKLGRKLGSIMTASIMLVCESGGGVVVVRIYDVFAQRLLF